jgi:hypothetical protein
MSVIGSPLDVTNTLDAAYGTIQGCFLRSSRWDPIAHAERQRGATVQRL